MTDIQQNYNPVKWGEIDLPIQSLTTSVSSKMEVNKYQNAKADYLRHFGFNSRGFDCQMVFDTSTNTYPDTYMDFIKKVNNKEKDIFQHPILGNVLCYVIDVKYEINTVNNRSGALVSATFMETLESQDSELVDPDLMYEPTTLDEYEIKAASELPENKDKPDLFETLNDIQELENKIASIDDKYKQEIVSAKNKLVNLYNKSIDIFKEGAHALNILAVIATRKKISFYANTTDNKIKKFKLEKDMSIFELENKLNNKRNKLIEMNPQISGKLIISRNTEIFYA